MIALRGRSEESSLSRELERSVFMLEDAGTVTPHRGGRAFVIEGAEPAPPGFDLYLLKGDARPPDDEEMSWVRLPPLLGHLSGRDVISVSQTGEHLGVLWRDKSPMNAVLLTERCDHYCLMCSQPPKEREDDWLMDNAEELIRLLPRDTHGIGFTGGEPTIYGDRLISLLKLCRNLLPFAGVHVLSNGRRFGDPDFASQWASVDNPQMMVGIPIYGAEAALHDYVVQSKGAFDETLRGIVNLGELSQRIEIRVVVHKQTAPHLPEIAEFIARNLPFVDQVALMGLEMMGFARANIDDVWIDPVDYREQLSEAVSLLARRRIKTMIYNHQLCLIDRELWPFAVRSISDWKNEYHPECLECSVRERCGGFFYSAKYRHSEHIKAIPSGDRESVAMLSLS
jgi:His-Xaa-Ser system radical SAM maturase HxsC